MGLIHLGISINGCFRPAAPENGAGRSVLRNRETWEKQEKSDEIRRTGMQ